MRTIIYHNPNCSTSRKVLAAPREAGHEPEVIEYLKQPPTKTKLKDLLKRMKMRPRELLRKKGTPYEELGLDDQRWTDEDIIGLMHKHPILIERPIVVTDRGARLCRPPETLNEILGSR